LPLPLLQQRCNRWSAPGTRRAASAGNWGARHPHRNSSLRNGKSASQFAEAPDDLFAGGTALSACGLVSRICYNSVKFTRIPHDRARRLYRLSGSAWALLIELDRLVFEGRGKNPVRLTHRCLKAAQLSRFAAKRALRALEKAGVISVEHRRGRAPLVTHLWFPATV
jgi:hypothetical protein